MNTSDRLLLNVITHILFNKSGNCHVVVNLNFFPWLAFFSMDGILVLMFCLTVLSFVKISLQQEKGKMGINLGR